MKLPEAFAVMNATNPAIEPPEWRDRCVFTRSRSDDCEPVSAGRINVWKSGQPCSIPNGLSCPIWA